MSRASAELRLRPMTDNDIDAVLALDQASHITPWSESNFRDALASGNLCLVGERDGAIVGCAVLQLGGSEADLLTMAVSPLERRTGIGRVMLREVIARADAYGAAAVFLEVRVSNTAALELYRDAGFERIGSRKGYYERGNGREDAITMRRDLEGWTG